MTIAINAQDVFAVIVIGLMVRIAWGQKVATGKADVEYGTLKRTVECLIGASAEAGNITKSEVQRIGLEAAKRDTALLEVMTATNGLVGEAVKSAIPQDKGATLRTKMAVNDLNKMAETEGLDPILIRDLLAEMGAEGAG